MSCSLPSGFNIGVVNTPQKILKAFCAESLNRSGFTLTKSQLDLLWSSVVSIFLIGAMIGSAVSAQASRGLGRRSSMVIFSIISLIGGGFFLASKQFDSVLMILLGRLLSGIHCGMASSLVPMYLMELSPAKHRPILGVLHSLGMTVGVLVAQVLGQESLFGNKANWPILLSFYTIFIMIGFTALLWVPESPVFIFMSLDDETRAVDTIKNLYGADCESEAIADLHRLKQEKKMSSNWSMMTVLKDQSVRRSLVLVCLLHVGQQMSGINAVFYYSTKMFENVGFSEYISQIGSIGVAAVNLVVGFIALPVLNSFRKKSLLLFSSGFAMIFLAALCVTIHFQDMFACMGFASIGLVMAYVVAYGLGLGPIPYMIGSDLFESGPRPFGMSLGCLFNWSFNFVVGISFPCLDALMNEYVYLIFSGACLILLVIVAFFLKADTEEDQPLVTVIVTPDTTINGTIRMDGHHHHHCPATGTAAADGRPSVGISVIG
jgi:sugar porter (SP) family MFS transporter